jgi:D-methionine transport system ATP-binding protein
MTLLRVQRLRRPRISAPEAAPRLPLAARAGRSGGTAVLSRDRASAATVVQPNHVLEVVQLSKVYEEHTALHPLDFTLDRGEVLAVVGPSGSGKSTLLQLINQIKRPSSGSVKLDGQELTTVSGSQLRLARRKIGMAFQSAALYSRRTARRNISIPLEYLGVTDRQLKEVTDHLLDRVGLTDRADYYPSQLSGGQKQRVGIARALALSPSVLLADEITSGLDPKTSESILELILSLRDEFNLAVVLVTHEMSIVRSVADSVLLLEDGHVVDRGRTSALLRDVHSRVGAQLHGLRTSRDAHEGRVVDLVYSSTQVPADWVSRLTHELGTNIDLLEASIEHVDGSAHGRARVRVGDADKYGALLELLPSVGLTPVTGGDR